MHFILRIVSWLMKGPETKINSINYNPVLNYIGCAQLS